MIAEAPGFHPSLAGDVAFTFRQLADQYPAAELKDFSLFEPAAHDESLGYTEDGEVRLSSRWFAAPANRLKAAALCNADTPWVDRAAPLWHGGMLEPAHTIAHEFGHVLMDALEARGDPRFARLLRDGYDRAAMSDPRSAPTGYALANRAEWFAEAFAAVHAGTDALRRNPGVVMVARFLEGL